VTRLEDLHREHLEVEGYRELVPVAEDVDEDLVALREPETGQLFTAPRVELEQVLALTRPVGGGGVSC
jgi:hypothetical protein